MEMLERKMGSDTSVRSSLKHDFGRYELRLLLITQMGYIPVAASMLMTTFFEPSKKSCQLLRQNESISWNDAITDDFYSITAEKGLACTPYSAKISTISSTILMVGALLGSFSIGFFADRFGRKPAVVGCLTIVSLTNFAFCFANVLNLPFFYGLQLILGIASGGYMVSNFVLLMEAFELPRSRLLAVSLNGWSVSMVVVAATAWITLDWRKYHAVFAAFALLFAICCQRHCYESCRWLSSAMRECSAKSKALLIAETNKLSNSCDIKELTWYEIIQFSEPNKAHVVTKFTKALRENTILRGIAVMCYCFTVSSVVSFGFYFNVDVLPGNRFLNMALMGLSKFALGFIPFAVSSWMSRKLVAVISVLLCVLSSLAILSIEIFRLEGAYWLVSVFSLLACACMDPTWKINHLYSAELFPTHIRSVARGFCNAGARLGSVVAPMIVYLRVFDSSLPYAIFSILLIFQFVVVVCFLPKDDVSEPEEVEE